MSQYKIAFYGDDFTGSTDALQALSTGGVRTVLFVNPPTEAELEKFDDIEAIGIAGQSRSMTPTEMEEELRPKFKTLSEFDVPIIHYKVCSTFDSSPTIGSIGKAIDIGSDVNHSLYVPLVVGVPELGRYVVFANHFAEYGGQVYRLDRHPVMSEHPITPMDESDLRRHLSEQTDKIIKNIDVNVLEGPIDSVLERKEKLANSSDIIIYDTLTDAHLEQVGKVLWRDAEQSSEPLFTVGSSGVEYALVRHWAAQDSHSTEPSFPELDPVDQLLVLSGSASPHTDSQIDWGVDNGFTPLRLETERLIDPDTREAALSEIVDETVAALNQGESVIVYSARGPDDPAIERTRNQAEQVTLHEDVGRIIGKQQGKLLRQTLHRTNLERVCVSGGDTCSYVTPELDIFALEVISPVAPGSPLCLAHSHEGSFDGLQIALKGGQLGQTDYFGRIKEGK